MSILVVIGINTQCCTNLKPEYHTMTRLDLIVDDVIRCGVCKVADRYYKIKSLTHADPRAQAILLAQYKSVLHSFGYYVD